MAYSFNFDSTYVEQNKEIILKDIVFGAVHGLTIPVMAKQLGVKGSMAIHPTTINPSLRTAEGCSFDPDGGLVISQRVIDTEVKKVNMEFCPDDLLNKFAEYKVRVGADEGALPFEGEIIEGVVKSVAKQVEADVWNKLLALDGDFKRITSNEGTYNDIMNVYAQIPEEVLEDGIIFVSPATFRQYITELVNKNLYHYNPADGDLNEMFLAGSGVKIRKAYGLPEGTIFATSPKNMIYGTDFLDNKEEVKLWYSDDADKYRLKVKFNYGVQVAFPELCVISTRE